MDRAALVAAHLRGAQQTRDKGFARHREVRASASNNSSRPPWQVWLTAVEPCDRAESRAGLLLARGRLLVEAREADTAETGLIKLGESIRTCRKLTKMVVVSQQPSRTAQKCIRPVQRLLMKQKQDRAW